MLSDSEPKELTNDKGLLSITSNCYLKKVPTEKQMANQYITWKTMCFHLDVEKSTTYAYELPERKSDDNIYTIKENITTKWLRRREKLIKSCNPGVNKHLVDIENMKKHSLTEYLIPLYEKEDKYSKKHENDKVLTLDTDWFTKKPPAPKGFLSVALSKKEFSKYLRQTEIEKGNHYIKYKRMCFHAGLERADYKHSAQIFSKLKWSYERAHLIERYKPGEKKHLVSVSDILKFTRKSSREEIEKLNKNYLDHKYTYYPKGPKNQTRQQLHEDKVKSNRINEISESFNDPNNYRPGVYSDPNKTPLLTKPEDLESFRKTPFDPNSIRESDTRNSYLKSDGYYKNHHEYGVHGPDTKGQARKKRRMATARYWNYHYQGEDKDELLEKHKDSLCQKFFREVRDRNKRRREEGYAELKRSRVYNDERSENEFKRSKKSSSSTD